jgi:hypothetical protein
LDILKSFNIFVGNKGIKSIMNYRILEFQGNIFYPQERRYIFYPWTYIVAPNVVYNERRLSLCCLNLEDAENLIIKRKDYLKNNTKYPIIHKFKKT